MSPQQLIIFQQLNRLFEKGEANPKQIRQLSELLASLNTGNITPHFDVIRQS